MKCWLKSVMNFVSGQMIYFFKLGFSLYSLWFLHGATLLALVGVFEVIIKLKASIDKLVCLF